VRQAVRGYRAGVPAGQVPLCRLGCLCAFEAASRYAWLKRTDAEEEPLFIARALLSEEIDEGKKLKYEMLQYEVIQD
jgi:hypothetical protein